MRKSLFWRTAFIVLAATLLVGCDPWNVSNVLVNPQPLAGSEVVIPVQIFAPQTVSGLTTSDVLIDIQLKRDSGFTDPIDGQVTARFHLANGNVWPLAQQISIGQSSHYRNVLLKLMCARHEPVGVPPNVELDINIFLPMNGTAGSGIPVNGGTEAAISADIEVLTWVKGKAENMETWNSPKPLGISCLRDNPIN